MITTSAPLSLAFNQLLNYLAFVLMTQCDIETLKMGSYQDDVVFSEIGIC